MCPGLFPPAATRLPAATHHHTLCCCWRLQPTMAACVTPVLPTGDGGVSGSIQPASCIGSYGMWSGGGSGCWHTHKVRVLLGISLSCMLYRLPIGLLHLLCVHCLNKLASCPLMSSGCLHYHVPKPDLTLYVALEPCGIGCCRSHDYDHAVCSPLHQAQGSGTRGCTKLW